MRIRQLQIYPQLYFSVALSVCKCKFVFGVYEELHLPTYSLAGFAAMEKL